MLAEGVHSSTTASVSFWSEAHLELVRRLGDTAAVLSAGLRISFVLMFIIGSVISIYKSFRRSDEWGRTISWDRSRSWSGGGRRGRHV